MKKIKLSTICLSILAAITVSSTALSNRINNHTNSLKSADNNTSIRRRASDVTWGDSQVWGELDIELYAQEAKIKGNVNYGTNKMNLNDKVYVNNQWLPIAGIAKRAFVDNKNMNGCITLGNYVRYVNSEAFANTNIDCIDFLTTIDTIDADAFANCKNLRSVYFNRNKQPIKNLDVNAFRGCNNVVFYIPHDCIELANQLQDMFHKANMHGCIVCCNIDPTIR